MMNKISQTLIVSASIVSVCAASSLAAVTKPSSPSPTLRVTPAPKTKGSPSPKTTPSPSPQPSSHPAATRPLPFHGLIAAVDLKAKTFSVGKEKARVFKVTNRTVLSKAGAAATMKDAVVNEEIRGSYWKMADGTLEAKTVKLGPKTDAEKAADEKAKARKKEKENATEMNAMPSVSPSASTSPKP